MPRNRSGGSTSLRSSSSLPISQQALQTNPPRIGDEAAERRALAVVGQQGAQTPAHAGVEAICYGVHGHGVVRGACGTQDAVETLGAGSVNPVALKPPGNLLLQDRRS